jgi:hypothetical protein
VPGLALAPRLPLAPDQALPGRADATARIAREESIMRKLIGVLALATVPIACGTVPTTPDLALPEATAEAAGFAASARVEPCSERADWSNVQGIVVQAVRSGKGSVTVRADLVLRSDVRLVPCYTPVFSVKPGGRGIELAGEPDRREATLRAPGGTYWVEAFVDGTKERAFVGGVLVEITGS